MVTGVSRAASVDDMDLEELKLEARAVMDPDAFDYFAGGADDEITLTENVAAWRKLRLRYQVLRDVSSVTAETTVLGTRVPAPILVAPTAYLRLAHEEGEIAMARGAAAAETICIASTLATVAIHEIAAAVPDAHLWFQVYVHRDRGWTKELVARAADAGCEALVLTVDAPVLGRRLRDERNQFTLPEGLEMANVGQAVPEVEGSGLAEYASEAIEPALTFKDIEWLAGLADLPVVVKGVVRGDDAMTALDSGAEALVVSNHGGRQLDTAVSTADALKEVCEALGEQAEVYVDGGIRRGTDIVKALALGAQAVLVGRPVLWGLATGGAEGVKAVLDHLREETERALALCGCSCVGGVPPDLVV